MSDANPWITHASRLMYENPWIRVREDDVTRPDGAPGIYGVVHFRNKAVGVLPVEANGDLWLVGQHRYPLDAYSWEIPEGGCPEGEAPDACALRELVEETGISAGHLEPLVTAHLSNSVSDEWGIVYRATALSHGPSRPDGCERLSLRRIPFNEALQMVECGAITDSLSVIAILHEALRRARDDYNARPRVRPIEFAWLPGTFAIVALDPCEPLPSWASGDRFLSITRSPRELSLVVDETRVPRDVDAARDWRALRLEGVFDLSETGVIASVSHALAASGIALFVISTFQTDYILVRSDAAALAEQTLTALGHVCKVPWRPTNP